MITDILQNIRDKVFGLSPVGAADQKLRRRVKDEDLDWTSYEEQLQDYRISIAAFNASRVLFYAGVISSIASTFNIYGLGIIQQIASYIGVSVIFVMYTVTRHISNRRRELYRVERELLINQAE